MLTALPASGDVMAVDLPAPIATLCGAVARGTGREAVAREIGALPRRAHWRGSLVLALAFRWWEPFGRDDAYARADAFRRQWCTVVSALRRSAGRSCRCRDCARLLYRTSASETQQRSER